MDHISATALQRGGRPTREQAKARHDALLETALDHFLDKGFEQATIDGIARDVGMTKRTIYARYADKTALFLAAVGLAIDRFTVPQAQIDATDTGDLEQTLVAIGWLRVEQVMTDNGLKLQRIINAESYRFPMIFSQSYEQSSLPTVRFLAALLERETAAGHLTIDAPVAAAGVFMSMVVGGPVRTITLGTPLNREEIDARIRYAVRLFLTGALSR